MEHANINCSFSLFSILIRDMKIIKVYTLNLVSDSPGESCSALQSPALKDSPHALLTTVPPITNYGEIWPHIQHKYTKF